MTAPSPSADAAGTTPGPAPRLVPRFLRTIPVQRLSFSAAGRCLVEDAALDLMTFARDDGEAR